MGAGLSMCESRGCRTVSVDVGALRYFEHTLGSLTEEMKRVSGTQWVLPTNAGPPSCNQLYAMDCCFWHRMNGGLWSLHAMGCKVMESLTLQYSTASSCEIPMRQTSLPLQDDVMELRTFEAENRNTEELKRAIEGLEAKIQDMTDSHAAKTTHFITEHATQLEKVKEEIQSKIVELQQESLKISEHARTHLRQSYEDNRKLELDKLCGKCELVSKQRDVLLTQNQSLQDQIGKLEVKVGRPCGSFREGVPTPNDMQLPVYNVKESLASFTKTVICYRRGVLKDVGQEVAVDCTKPLTTLELELERSSDNKFRVQRTMSAIVFLGFEAEDFHIRGCESEEMDVDKRQRDSYMQYHELKESIPLGNDSLAMMGNQREEFGVSPCSGATHQASRGQQRFLKFRHKKAKEIMNAGKLPKGCDREECNLTRSLDQLLRDVWLCHLLAFSFDPPCTMFKVKAGAVFDSAYMESVRDEETDYNAVRTVAFMVIPGFHVGKAVVRALVFTVSRSSTLMA